MPIFLPSTRVAPGGRLSVWGQLRPAPNATQQIARIQWQGGHGGYRTIATVVVPPSSAEGYFTSRVGVPGSGSVRIAWTSPGGGVLVSRAVGVQVG
jgi:hypothetical protein